MESRILEQKREYESRRRRRKCWKSVVTALACVVVFCTTYALILPAITMENTAYCGLEEHVHGEECWQTNLICELTEEETEEHIHREDCYEEMFICELEEHAHEIICYADHTADVETAEIWEATLPGTLSGVLAEDLAAVAESQIGYEESTANYIVAEDGTLKGYSRYGAWYGEPYGDWSSMFVSFCLHYANVDESLITRTTDITEASPGDLVWFSQGSDRRGIIVDRTDDQIKVIEGDAEDKVDYRICSVTDGTITEYGLLPRPAEEETPAEEEPPVTEEAPAEEVPMEEEPPAEEEPPVTEEESATEEEAAPAEEEVPEEEEIPVEEEPLEDEIPAEEEPPVTEEETPTINYALSSSSDAYAPEDITLTGVWAKDVAAIAESQVGYAEESSLSKIDQWAGGDGTGYWNVNFVNYCLHYAGVDCDTIPWDVSYDFAQWKTALEEKGVLQAYDANQLKAGDLVFVQGWNAGYNLNVGVCIESSGGAFYIVFGDMDVNGKVTREQFWSGWSGRFLGFVSLSEELTVTTDGVLSASASYNSGVLPYDAELQAVLTEEQDTYRQLAEAGLIPAGKQIQEDYYLEIYFTQNGQRIEPAGDLNVEIQFANALSPNISTSADSGEQEWLYGVIGSDSTITEATYEMQAEQDESANITDVTVAYLKDTVYAMLSVQETKTTLSVETPYGTAAATASSTVLNENMQLVIRFIEDDTEAWTEKIKEIYESNKNIVSANRFFQAELLDESGNPATLPEGAEVEIELTFDPPLSSALEDGTTARSGDWMLHALTDGDGSTELEATDGDVSISSEIALESVRFTYAKKDVYALSAVVTNPDYYEEITTYDALAAALTRAESASQLRLGASIEVPEGSSAFTIESGRSVCLDLNGYDITTSSELFIVNAGAELTLTDSQASAVSTETVAELHLRADEDGDSEEQLAANKANVGMLASYDEAAEQLTYYVTGTEITDSDTGATKETLIKHTVTLQGSIKGGASPVIQVNGGTFTMEGGAITNCTNGAIRQSGGTLELTGGYICNNKNPADGGAITSDNGAKIIVDGTVIAANRASEDGGAVWINGSEFSMKSGVVSGNEAAMSGGGLFCTGSTAVEISGGYITNNRANTTEYRGGGGGIFTNEKASINLTGGYITGNYAESGGGGLRTFAERFRMTGGFVNSNYANLSEGGGISINEYGVATIIGGYVNNNVSNTHQHWGGGGIFTANDSTVYIRRVLVTENDAGGYGGGVAGCSTGRAFIYEEDGGAIYDNTAVARDSENPHISGGESTKAEDHIYPTSMFRKYGYEDYFCAFNSTISGTMLGGGSANWSGTVDGIPVVVSKGEEVSSSYLMGLESNPSNADILNAQAQARLYVNGNDSYTHGGGILGNGYLVIGRSETISVYSRLRIDATKELTGEELQDGQFEFIIENMNNGFQVAAGTNDADGNITFDHMIPFTEKGTYEYLIYERHDEEYDGEYNGILMDTSEYKVTVTVDVIEEELETFAEELDTSVFVKKERFVITSIVVEKRNGGNWETVQTISEPENPDSKPVVLELTRGASFHNVVTEYTKFSVVKQWMGDIPLQPVQVQLLRDGQAYGVPVELSADNHWSYQWEEELPLSYLDEETGEKAHYKYSVVELDVPEGYYVAYDYFNTTESKAVWIPYTDSELILEQDYIIVSPDGAYVLYVSDQRNNRLITEEDKISVVRQTDSILINGQEYHDYIQDGLIQAPSIYRAQASNGVRLNNPSTGYRALAVPWDGSSYNLESSWWPLRDLYAGNARICVGSEDKYMVVFENDKFDAVPYDASNTNAARLYTMAYTDPSNETIFTITNSKVEEEEVTYKLDITKVSAENADVLLAGAEFALYMSDEEGNADLTQQVMFTRTSAGAYEYLQFKDSEEVTPADIAAAVTARGGKLVISGLPKGGFVLVETKAPNGYQIAEPVRIVFDDVSEQTVTYRITIEDKEAYESYVLPETGGTGRYQNYITGLLLIVIGVLIQLYRKKKINNRRN